LPFLGTVADPGARGHVPFKLMTDFKRIVLATCTHMSCVRYLSNVTNNHVHNCAATMELLQKTERHSCHQMASLAFRFYKIQFRPGHRPGPCWGTLRRSPKPLVGWEGIPLPIPNPLGVESQCLRHQKNGH